MKKTLALVLAVLMLASFAVACAKPDDDNTDETTPVVADTTAADVGNDETQAPETEFVQDDLDGKTFDNAPVVIMYWEDVEKIEFFSEELTGDIVSDGIYNRNLTVEERLKVKLDFVGTPGNYNNQNNFISKADASIKSGGDYDVFAGYSMTGATLALRGFGKDVMEEDNISLDKPWWPAGLVDQATTNGKLYFLSGDISTNMLHMMYAVFFNKGMIEKNSLESPYELADAGKWTYTKMFEMASNLYVDENGDGAKDEADGYGFATASIHYDAFFIGSGLRTVDKAPDGSLMISPSFNSENTIKLVNDICHYMWETNDCYHGATGACFRNDNTLFTLDRSYMALNQKDNISFEYGVVPTPKFDEAQEKYVTTLGFPYTTYVISIATKNSDAVAATLECLGSEGYRQVTPMLFETNMKLKYTSDDIASRMFDVIRETVNFDLGRFFCTPLNNITYSTFRDRCSGNSANVWASIYKVNEKTMDKLLKKINDTFAAMD